MRTKTKTMFEKLMSTCKHNIVLQTEKGEIFCLRCSGFFDEDFLKNYREIDLNNNPNSNSKMYAKKDNY
jgi:hypothetical protein